MPYDPDRHHRRSIRLKGYDYAQSGAYFVTLVTQDRACLFGQVVNGLTQLSDGGLAAESCWLAIPDHYPFVELDAFVIMPNHVHGIIVITPGEDQHAANADVGGMGNNDRIANDVGANDHSPLRSPPPRSAISSGQPFRSPSQTVGSIIRGFKIGVTKWFRANTDVYTVWQRNYHDHIIRDEPSLHRIQQYIANNPMKWAMDNENPTRR